jgi:hypothetical protein
MEIHQATELGQLGKTLGLAATSRITFEVTNDGVMVWDLDHGIKYTVSVSSRHVNREAFEVPKQIKEIFDTPDDVLKKRWDDHWSEGWTEEREIIFTELCRRGVSMLPWHKR